VGLLSTLGSLAGGVIGTIVAPGVGTAIGAGLGGAAGSLGDSVTGGSGSSGSGSGVNSLVNPALAASDVAYGSQDYNTANQLRQAALSSAVTPYNEKAPLRNQALAGLENYQLPNLNQAFSPGSSNPFYTPLAAPPSSYGATGPYQGGGSGSGTLGTPSATSAAFQQLPAAQQSLGNATQTAANNLPANMPIQITPLPGMPGHFKIGINPGSVPVGTKLPPRTPASTFNPEPNLNSNLPFPIPTLPAFPYPTMRAQG